MQLAPHKAACLEFFGIEHPELIAATDPRPRCQPRSVPCLEIRQRDRRDHGTELELDSILPIEPTRKAREYLPRIEANLIRTVNRKLKSFPFDGAAPLDDLGCFEQPQRLTMPSRFVDEFAQNRGLVFTICEVQRARALVP